MLLSSPGTEQEDTPLTLRSPHARGSFILLSVGPPGVSAEPLPARLRQLAQPSRQIVFSGGRVRRGRCAQPAGQPRGGVRATSPAGPDGPRPPAGRRPSTDCSAGFRERVSAPARGSSLPPTHRRPRPPVPGTSQEAPPGFRPAGQCPHSRASSTADGQGAGDDGPAPCGPERSGAPRARPVANPGCDPPATGHRLPPTPPACVRQRPLAPAPHLRSAPAAAHRPDRLCTPEVTYPDRPRPRPKRTPGWLRTQSLGAEPPSRRQGGGGPQNLLP